MIEQKDVVTMKIPFPTISDDLAVYPHMYVCLESERESKHFLKCQSLKPYHLGKNKAPFKRIIENVNANRHPFKRTTIIDCDKFFSVQGVQISTDLLAKMRKDVCPELFKSVIRVSNYPNLEEHQLDSESLTKINHKIKVLY